jgi:hypothetical protein
MSHPLHAHRRACSQAPSVASEVLCRALFCGPESAAETERIPISVLPSSDSGGTAAHFRQKNKIKSECRVYGASCTFTKRANQPLFTPPPPANALIVERKPRRLHKRDLRKPLHKTLVVTRAYLTGERAMHRALHVPGPETTLVRPHAHYSVLSSAAAKSELRRLMEPF